MDRIQGQSSSARSLSPVIQLGHDSIVARDHVRLLGATISSDLSLDRHVANVSSTGFYWLRQLRRVRRSLDMESATTLVYAFVSSRVDYCNILFAGSPKVVTDRLQRVINAAARVLSSTHKYDRGLSRLLRASLARCAGKSSVQTRRRYVQLLARPITAIPRRSLCTSVQRLSKAASSIRYSASLGGSAMLAQHTRSTNLLCGRPVALELSTRQLERSGSWQGQLQTFAENASIFTVLKHLAY